jgi:hypothetical protein
MASKESMKSQMEIGAEIIEQLWEKLMPYELPNLRSMPAERIVVIRGSYDHVEEILKNAKIPHSTTNVFPTARDLTQGGKYQGNRILFVNCDNHYHESIGYRGLSRTNKPALVDFVNQGGRMITTDWAQKVVSYLFGKISAKQGVLPEKVVEINFPNNVGKNLLGINYTDAKPKWWIEYSSDAITPKKDSGIVELITSDELQKQDRTKYIAIGFKQGQGEVFHFVSHLVAQKFRHDGARDNQNLQAFLDQTGTKLKKSSITKYVSFGGIETTYTLMNTVLELIRENPIL